MANSPTDLDTNSVGVPDRIPLLVDVDGVINVIGAGVDGILDRGLVPHDAMAETGVTYRLLIDPKVGELLLGLTDLYELVWCTTWKNANAVISPLLGLPTDLRRVPLPGSWEDVTPNEGWSAKVPYIRRWAAGVGVERLAWIDDDTEPQDTRALCESFAHKPSNPMVSDPPLSDVLALYIAPDRGLEWHHIQRLREWAGPSAIAQDDYYLQAPQAESPMTEPSALALEIAGESMSEDAHAPLSEAEKAFLIEHGGVDADAFDSGRMAEARAFIAASIERSEYVLPIRGPWGLSEVIEALPDMPHSELVALLNAPLAELNDASPIEWLADDGAAWVVIDALLGVPLGQVVERAMQIYPLAVVTDWLIGSNGYLNGARPIDVIRLRGPQEVLAALDAEEQGAM